jgi:ribulose-5-phosphate 4-epimerase/fuculose-1-phosphate aldolase
MSVVAELRRTLSELHQDLVRGGLVAWTSGNISARVPGAELIVIKPSGVGYDELTAESMVVVERHGDPRLHIPRDAGGRRRRAHTQPVRDGVGGERNGDPVRADGDGR